MDALRRMIAVGMILMLGTVGGSIAASTSKPPMISFDQAQIRRVDLGRRLEETDVPPIGPASKRQQEGELLISCRATTDGRGLFLISAGNCKNCEVQSFLVIRDSEGKLVDALIVHLAKTDPEGSFSDFFGLPLTRPAGGTLNFIGRLTFVGDPPQHRGSAECTLNVPAAR